MKKKKVYITLQNGDVFEGYRFGADGNANGELVFSTGMVGYVETLTDPSNIGKIVVQTFPLIGNYGVAPTDAESDKAWVSAYIVREFCQEPSNFRMEHTLDEYLKEKGVIGVYGIDTRELTKILREDGVMNARISDKPAFEEDTFDDFTEFRIEDAVKTVAPTKKEEFGNATAKYTVALWNFGAKKSTIENLTARNMRVISMPAFSTAEEILALNVDGIVLSEGPESAEDVPEIISEVKKVLGKKPVFGLGLGHQLVAVALGAKTVKHKYGHRGGNQPVKCKKDGRVYISSQNHGYEVWDETMKEGEISFVNVNDGSCEGIDYDALNAFTVQFAPEVCDLGNEENPLYKKFFALMEKEKENA